MSGAPLLILGRGGQLARAVVRRAEAADVAVISLGRETLDLSHEAPEDRLRAARPWAVINTAAFTAVDAAEADPEAAERLNAGAPGRLARACADMDIPFVHVSTDYVFDGRKGEPYVESDTPYPLSAYGRSKLAGEEAVKGAGGRAVTVRTSALFGGEGVNFVTTMLKLAAGRDEVRVVHDQVTCPTLADDLAEALLAAAFRLRDREALPDILHFAGTGAVSWDRLATEIFRRSARAGGPSARVVPVTAEAYGAAAKRPADSRLDSGLARRELGLEARSWDAALDMAFEKKRFEG